jgi:hypothetical protein
MVTVEIYFKDLNPEAQERLLEEFQTTEEDENWEIIPIAIIEREIDPN